MIQILQEVAAKKERRETNENKQKKTPTWMPLTNIIAQYFIVMTAYCRLNYTLLSFRDITFQRMKVLNHIADQRARCARSIANLQWLLTKCSLLTLEAAELAAQAKPASKQTRATFVLTQSIQLYK